MIRTLHSEASWGSLEAKDVLTLGLSSLSLIVAFISFVLSFRQRSTENTRTTMTKLTDTLGELGDINLAMAELAIDKPEPTDTVMSLRRAYNGKRRYLAAHADLLVRDAPHLVGDIEHQMLATAFESMGDYSRALNHWERAVSLSPAPSLRAMNLRGFARFLFFQGNPASERQKYEESLQVNMVDTENTRRLRADTCLMWSVTEREFGFGTEAERRRDQAIAEARRIGHPTSSSKSKCHSESHTP